LQLIGHDGPGFAYDNETPRHRRVVQPFQLADRLTTCGEYLEFIADDGYARPELWLSDGWKTVQDGRWNAPLYWLRDGRAWRVMTLGGLRPLDPAEPVCHVSYYEADAYARWRGAALPTEEAWEIAAREAPVEGNFLEAEHFHPRPASGRAKTHSALSNHQPPTTSRHPPRQMFGDGWEWTRSPYTAYPGFRPPAGALGEYNGKFMCNQMVLRGGACVTPRSHIRPTYRNFFPPEARWPFTAIRLAKESYESRAESQAALARGVHRASGIGSRLSTLDSRPSTLNQRNAS
jgi:ergothioneine biosynthesis protein EgtB